MTITVYTRNHCAACNATKKQLGIRGLPYEEINAEEHPEVAQWLVDQGWRAMPVVRVRQDDGNDLWWSGIDMDAIKSL